MAPAADTDHDGLSDRLEEQLLKKFRPRFLVDARECDGKPAEFTRGVAKPVPGARNGTIYGQVFRAGGAIEIHYYHLWANDCGRGGHPLDAEHVAVWLEPVGREWKAVAWMAAGHEGTLCDRRHGALASAMDATERGATVWISHGKHASFLSQAACAGGCGADRCDRPVTLAPGKLINIGEASAPYPGYAWIRTRAGSFDVAAKMTTEFAPADLAAMRKAGKLVSLTPVPRPAQAVIYGGNATADAVTLGRRTATGHVDRALTTSYAKVRESLRKAREFTRRR